jgi:hypothetical protein
VVIAAHVSAPRGSPCCLLMAIWVSYLYFIAVLGRTKNLNHMHSSFKFRSALALEDMASIHLQFGATVQTKIIVLIDWNWVVHGSTPSCLLQGTN